MPSAQTPTQQDSMDSNAHCFISGFVSLMRFNSLLRSPGRSVSGVWKKWMETQDEKRKSRALLEGAGRSSSAAAALQSWTVAVWLEE